MEDQKYFTIDFYVLEKYDVKKVQRSLLCIISNNVAYSLFSTSVMCICTQELMWNMKYKYDL